MVYKIGDNFSKICVISEKKIQRHELVEALFNGDRSYLMQTVLPEKLVTTSDSSLAS